MSLLRLTQHIEKEDHYRVEIAFEDDDGSRLTADPKFQFELTSADRADLRWYLEDYLQYPMDPAPQIAARVEARMAELGKSLFHLLFEGDAEAREMLPDLRKKLDDTRVEVVTDVAGAAALPWELLRDPRTEAALALRAKAFVRAYSKPVQKAYIPKPADKIRILLVICRPGGREDVPFRSVASRLLKGLGGEAREAFELDVLRPPTFAQLSKALREAKAQGKPYHILHFDGHGAYLESDKKKLMDLLRRLGALMFTAPREGSHGYLLFENAQADENIELVDGLSLGQLLVETDTPALILNACQSAYAEPALTPALTPGPSPEYGRGESEDVHSQVRAFGLLAQEVMDAGVADLYAALASGQTLGEAVSMGRKQLAAQPLREIAFEPRPLQDWCVPVVYEAAPIQLLPRAVGATGRSPLHIDLTQPAKADDGLPRPEIGFFGRDETLLALDRAFDSQPVVLLHAYAGSGKTMTAAEFARWYRDTGGLSPRNRGEAGGGLILFTSFEHHKPLARALDAVEQTFRPLLEHNNIHWLAMSDDERLNVTLQIFQQIPVLWIWDNVEPIAGFPSGTGSAWTEKEQRELKTFLQIISAQSKAKFLLTSRRDEQKWLGDLPRRVTLPPMPVQEMVQLARALAEKLGRKMSAVDDWKPLLDFTQGNPMTLTVLARQALRDGLKTKAQIYAYVNRLRRGEAAFADEASEGRTKSLGASLAYGFEQAFSENERKVLALLHFFQGFVDVDALRQMGHLKTITGEDHSLPELSNLQPATFNTLLDKAAEIGLLTAHGGGYYTIHPALPWFFKSLFDQYYPNEAADSVVPPSSSFISPLSSLALRAFVASLGALGDYYHNTYGAGNREVIAALRAEEPNLLHARALALRLARELAAQGDTRQHGWWMALMETMQGLQVLYDHTGRRAEWKRLVEEIVPDFVGADDLPLPGREEQWSLVTEYRVLLAQEARDWNAAERLQRVCVDWDRHNAAALLARPPKTLTGGEKNTLRSLAVSIEQLGHIQREQGKPECADTYKVCIPLYQRIGDQPAEAVAAFNLGHAYKDLPALRDLDEAEGWYRRSLELRAAGDRKGKGGCLAQLGLVAYERFKDARRSPLPLGDPLTGAGGPGVRSAELLKHLDAAADYCRQALALLPPDAVDDLAVTHNQLGLIYMDAGDLERALYHYNQDIHYDELAGNQYGAGQTRFNIALMLSQNERLSDALLYARAALRNFEPYGPGAAEEVERTQGLIAWIEQEMKKQ
ncbi:MAG: tetratricopeptide repeat protein [Anaerolineales bacterium]|nr:tetratricopeptide repeat protein [Anaerolineales bacterium]